MMMKATLLTARYMVAVLATTILGQACTDSQPPVAPAEVQVAVDGPAYSLSSGTVSSLIGRSTIVDGFKVKRKTGSWEFDIHAKDPADISVATLVIQPGGNSGWHTHPGPGFVQVTSGTARFYDAGDPSCTPIEVSTGHAWLDRGETTHIARNETDAPVTLLVTLFIPPGAGPRIDEPVPGNCPF